MLFEKMKDILFLKKLAIQIERELEYFFNIIISSNERYIIYFLFQRDHLINTSSFLSLLCLFFWIMPFYLIFIYEIFEFKNNVFIIFFFICLISINL
jgi:hypothetical protein